MVYACQTDCKIGINSSPLPVVFTVPLTKGWGLFSHPLGYGLGLYLLWPIEYGRSVDVPFLSLETLCPSVLSQSSVTMRTNLANLAGR